jgi:hypothetical protein
MISMHDFSVVLHLLLSDSGMEHVRVHPKFLHSNATSHKWALGGTFHFTSLQMHAQPGRQRGNLFSPNFRGYNYC